MLDAIGSQRQHPAETSPRSKNKIGQDLVNFWLPQLINKPNLIDKQRAHIFGILKILLKHGINIIPESVKDQQKLIAIANREGEQELTQYINYRIVIDAKDHEGKTRLHKAAETGDIELTQQLLEQNAEIDSQDAAGKTPLHLACRAGHEEIVNMLIAHNADINKQDYQDDRPITEALIHEHIVVLMILENQGGNLKLDRKILKLIYTTPNLEIQALLREGAATTDYFMSKATYPYVEHNYIKFSEKSSASRED